MDKIIEAHEAVKKAFKEPTDMEMDRCGRCKGFLDKEGENMCLKCIDYLTSEPEPSDMEKIFTYLAEAEKERQNMFKELIDKLDYAIEAIDKLETIWEK